MKKLLIVSLAAVALGASTSAFAQAAGPVGGAPKSPLTGPAGRGAAGAKLKEMEKMNEDILAKLNLTPDQKAKIAAHQKENQEKMLALRKAAKGAGQTGDAREKMKELRKENQQFMKDTLTKDQLKQYMQLRREAMKEMQSKNGTTTPAAPPVKP